MTDEAEHDGDCSSTTSITVDDPRKRLCYTRAEMQVLRFRDPDRQQLYWTSLYNSLEPVIAREYDGLCSSMQSKRSDSRKDTSRRKKERTVTAVRPKDDNEKRIDVVEDDGKMTNVLDPFHDGGSKNDMLDDCHVSRHENFLDECDPTLAEEPYHEDEDSDNNYDSIQKPAFLVEGEPDFESGSPEDGLEYLRRVKWEAAQLPRVKVANFDSSKCKEQTSYMPKIPDIVKCPESLLPRKDWVNIFLDHFAKLREIFVQLECLKTGQLCHATVDCSVAASGSSQTDDLPTVSTLLSMNAISRATMLRKCVDEFDNQTTLSRHECLWLFALCATVDAPLDAGMCATMRSLLRKCSILIASKSDSDDDEVAMLNILIAILGNYFGQSDKSSA